MNSLKSTRSSPILYSTPEEPTQPDHDINAADSETNASESDKGIHPHDVVLQPDERAYILQGNDRFRRLIQNNVGIYQASTLSATERFHIAQSIVGSIKQNGGRFLKYVASFPLPQSVKTAERTGNAATDNTTWILKEIPNAEAEEFTRASLEAAAHQNQLQEKEQGWDFWTIHRHRQPHKTQQPRTNASYRPVARSLFTTSPCRMPFQELMPEPNLYQESEDETPHIFPMALVDKSGIDMEDDDISSMNECDEDYLFCNEENNDPRLGNALVRPPPPPPLLTKMSWNLSPIRVLRKRISSNESGQEDRAEFHSPSITDTYISCMARPSKRRRLFDDNEMASFAQMEFKTRTNSISKPVEMPTPRGNTAANVMPTKVKDAPITDTPERASKVVVFNQGYSTSAIVTPEAKSKGEQADAQLEESLSPKHLEIIFSVPV